MQDFYYLTFTVHTYNSGAVFRSLSSQVDYGTLLFHLPILKPVLTDARLSAES